MRNLSPRIMADILRFKISKRSTARAKSEMSTLLIISDSSCHFYRSAKNGSEQILICVPRTMNRRDAVVLARTYKLRFGRSRLESRTIPGYCALYF